MESPKITARCSGKIFPKSQPIIKLKQKKEKEEDAKEEKNAKEERMRNKRKKKKEERRKKRQRQRVFRDIIGVCSKVVETWMDRCEIIKKCENVLFK